MSNEIAPKGKIWQCRACGKRSRDLYGDQSLDYGWDESCVLNAALVDDVPKSKSEAKRLKIMKEEK